MQNTKKQSIKALLFHILCDPTEKTRVLSLVNLDADYSLCWTTLQLTIL